MFYPIVTIAEKLSTFLTYYSYDEAGSRFAKTIFKYTNPNGPSEDTSNAAPENEDTWELYSVEIYSRDVSGKELAIYKDNAALEFPVYGLDMIGKIKDNDLFYYLKDHLGSVRATMNSSAELVSAQDYDAWGYLLEGRQYESDSSKFKFTGKERDEESDYDYFGARYYDARVGRWGGVDVKYYLQLDQSPYNYCINNPMIYTDYRGEKIYWGLDGEYSQSALDELMSITGLDLSIDEEGFLYLLTESIYGGSETARNKIIEAIGSSNILEVYSDFRYGTLGEVGGTIVNLNPSEILSFIGGVNGGLNPLSQGWGISLMHEIYHTKFGISQGHEENDFGEVGEVEGLTNILRRELGFPERMSYQSKKVIDEYGKVTRIIPFDKESLEYLGTRRNDFDLNKIPGQYIKY